MTTTINASNSGSGGLVQTADASGVLALQTAGTTALTLDTSQNATFAGYANLPNTFGFKNRIINGAMVIDQRNAGASVTPANGAYTLDRWAAFTNGVGVYTVQQSSTAPSGFSNSILSTVTTIDSSVAGTDYYMLQHKIEGFNSADFAWGTASAAAVTLSFWVRSSITGTYSVKLGNSASDRFYVATYTISSANTWEQKTISLSGDTSGTWVTNNGTGIEIRFGFAIGSSFTTSTIAAWSAGSSFGATTASNNWIGTNGATFYITGVQLEKGSTATSFDVRSYGTELALCQRYCFVPSSDTSGTAYNTTTFYSQLKFPVVMRASPSSTYSAASGYNVFSNNTGAAPSAVSTDTAFTDGILIKATGTYVTSSGGFFRQGSTIYSAEL